MSPGIRIDRCLCTGMAFEEVKRLKDELGLSFEALTAQTGAGRQCTLCQIYLAWMHADGRTVFRQLENRFPEGYEALPTMRQSPA